MTTTEIKIMLPEPLALEAAELGLLEGPAIAAMLQEEVRKRHVERLFADMDRLAALDIPPMTPEEVEAEIAAVRRERRRGSPSGS